MIKKKFFFFFFRFGVFFTFLLAQKKWERKREEGVFSLV